MARGSGRADRSPDRPSDRRGGTANGPMIRLRRAGERHHYRRRTQEVWLTFNPQDRADLLAQGFGLVFDDDHQQLAAELPVYDALLAWCKQQDGR